MTATPMLNLSRYRPVEGTFRKPVHSGTSAVLAEFDLPQRRIAIDYVRRQIHIIAGTVRTDRLAKTALEIRGAVREETEHGDDEREVP